MLHWTADLPGALVQLRRALRPDGLLLAAMLGGQTLVELRTALFEAELEQEGGVSPRVSPAIELGDAAALLQRAGYALPVADSETITVAYSDALALMRDLRCMGETNALSARRRSFLRRSTLARAALIYAERFAEPDGNIPATFEVLYLCGWAPHPSQPKPLPRGSATARLADALQPGAMTERYGCARPSAVSPSPSVPRAAPRRGFRSGRRCVSRPCAAAAAGRVRRGRIPRTPRCAR